MGSRLAWAFKVSPAVVLRAPVMSLVILCWTEVSFLAHVTEPWHLASSLVCIMLVNQTSEAYVNAGTVNVLYSCLTLHGGMPPEILVSLAICLTHQAALAMILH